MTRGHEILGCMWVYTYKSDKHNRLTKALKGSKFKAFRDQVGLEDIRERLEEHRAQDEARTAPAAEDWETPGMAAEVDVTD